MFTQLLGALAAAGALLGIGSRYLSARDARLARERTGRSFATFRDQLGPAVPAPVAAAVYDYLQRWTRGAFPALPEDKIAVVYGIVGEDFDEMLIELTRRSGCPEGALAHLPEIGTVADLTRFLADCGHRGAAGGMENAS